MTPDTFNAVDPKLDSLAELADKHLADTQFHRLLAELSKVLGEGYEVSINLTVEISEEERSLPVRTTGLCAIQGREPFRTSGDSTPQRYVVKDGIQVVPHDRRPLCWEVWDFKWKNPSCEHCGARLGEDCKILLDTDVCPFCEKGKVTMAKPRCEKCGFQVDPKTVVWG